MSILSEISTSSAVPQRTQSVVTDSILENSVDSLAARILTNPSISSDPAALRGLIDRSFRDMFAQTKARFEQKLIPQLEQMVRESLETGETSADLNRKIEEAYGRGVTDGIEEALTLIPEASPKPEPTKTDLLLTAGTVVVNTTKTIATNLRRATLYAALAGMYATRIIDKLMPDPDAIDPLEGK